MIFSSVRKFRGVALAILALGGMAGTITPVLAATRLIIDTVDQGIPGKAQIVVSEGRVRLTHSEMPRQEVLFVADSQEVFLNVKLVLVTTRFLL